MTIVCNDVCIPGLFFLHRDDINEHIIVVLLTPEHILDSCIETARLSSIYHLGV